MVLSELFSVSWIEVALFLPTIISTQKERKLWDEKHTISEQCEMLLPALQRIVFVC